MHICYIADARSPIAKSWISHFVARNHRVTMISSYPCADDEIPGAELIEFPFALSSLSRVSHDGTVRNHAHGMLNKVVAEFRSGRLARVSNNVRTLIAPIGLNRRAERVASLIREIQPDLVHAMRLPFEGFLGALAVKSFPLLLSVWGNDFTLFSARTRKLSKLAAAALERSDGLHCDCNRDMNIAFDRGFSRAKPWRVLPGNGGLEHDFGRNPEPDLTLLREFNIPENVPLIINPRGFRVYVRNDTFFRSIPLILEKVPNAFFLAVGMANNPVAERWIRHMNVASSIRLLPTVTREQLAVLFAASAISVSPSSHDGTPNTLLEAMACGSFPVVGRVDSLREWIVDGENGLFCDEGSPESLAACVVRGLADKALRVAAAKSNRELVESRAARSAVMAEAEMLYSEVVKGSWRASTVSVN